MLTHLFAPRDAVNYNKERQSHCKLISRDEARKRDGIEEQSSRSSLQVVVPRRWKIERDKKNGGGCGRIRTVGRPGNGNTQKRRKKIRMRRRTSTRKHEERPRNCPEIRIESVKVLLLSFADRRVRRFSSHPTLSVSYKCVSSRVTVTGLMGNWFYDWADVVRISAESGHYTSHRPTSYRLKKLQINWSSGPSERVGGQETSQVKGCVEQDQWKDRTNLCLTRRMVNLKSIKLQVRDTEIELSPEIMNRNCNLP